MSNTSEFIDENRDTLNGKKEKYISKFKNQLNERIRYYEHMYEQVARVSPLFSKQMLVQLEIARKDINQS